MMRNSSQDVRENLQTCERNEQKKASRILSKFKRKRLFNFLIFLEKCFLLSLSPDCLPLHVFVIKRFLR